MGAASDADFAVAYEGWQRKFRRVDRKRVCVPHEERI